MTLSMDTPENMAETARGLEAKLLKLKLGGPEDLVRVEAVHSARPDAQLILDGNEAIEPKDLPGLSLKAVNMNTILIEQPFPAGQEEKLLRAPGPVALCADESAHTANDIQNLARYFDAVNVKIDKTGGLTGAIEMVKAARKSGMGVMIGCMVGGSLSIAPAMLLAGLADIADLDGPIWLAEDIAHGIAYKDGLLSPPERQLWG